MHTKKELDQRLQLAGFRPIKQLGQNFLVNPEICRRILQPVFDFKPQTVVEIGPGMGALTDELIGQGPELLLIELDSGFADYWKTREPSVKLWHQDALKVDWDKLPPGRPRALVSNLPYSIAASLVIEMSSSKTPPFDFMVLMFQKEVAQRIHAEPSDEDYGMLSVVAQANWSLKKIVDGGPQDFYPVPNVGSRVLAFTLQKVSFDRAQFLSFMKLAFSQRRKKLANNLSARFSPTQLNQAFEALGISESSRAQEFPPAKWIELFSYLIGQPLA